MTDAPPDPFSPQVSAAVAAHMNGDHTEDNLLIARSLGGQPDATAASMTGVRPDGAVFEATVDGAPTDVVVPWAEPITERAQVRMEVVRMHTEAAAALGLPAREH